MTTAKKTRERYFFDLGVSDRFNQDAITVAEFSSFMMENSPQDWIYWEAGYSHAACLIQDGII